jgi:hypothetical protein
MLSRSKVYSGPPASRAQIVLRCAPAIWPALLIAGVIPLASAQAPDAGSASAAIATDRPAITDSSAVVPSAVFQAENGVLVTDGHGQRTPDFTETLFRVGFGPSTEARFTVPDYYLDSVTAAGSRSGFGDLAAGVKQQIRTGPDGFEVAVIVSLSFPTGAAAITSHGYDPSFQLPWSRKLSSNWTAAGMLSIYVPTQNGSHTVVGESTFLLDRQLTKAWDAFAEYAGDFPQAGGPRHVLHFGTAYKITPRQQLDLHVGVGLSAAAADYFAGIGYSFSFRIARR